MICYVPVRVVPHRTMSLSIGMSEGLLAVGRSGHSRASAWSKQGTLLHNDPWSKVEALSLAHIMSSVIQ
jgi:hypothetical protein